MWSSSAWRAAEAGPDRARRRLLGALAALPWALAALPGRAASDPTAGLRRWGSGEFRRFGFLIYEATLWAGDDPLQPPLALRLDYKYALSGRAIAKASVDEMRRQGAGAAQLAAWGEALARLFPDVANGDHIVGIYRPEGAHFVHNGRALGEIADAEFARRFFAIWLDPRTRAPEVRAALLGQARP